MHTVSHTVRADQTNCRMKAPAEVTDSKRAAQLSSTDAGTIPVAQRLQDGQARGGSRGGEVRECCEGSELAGSWLVGGLARRVGDARKSRREQLRDDQLSYKLSVPRACSRKAAQWVSEWICRARPAGPVLSAAYSPQRGLRASSLGSNVEHAVRRTCQVAGGMACGTSARCASY